MFLAKAIAQLNCPCLWFRHSTFQNQMVQGCGNTMLNPYGISMRLEIKHFLIPCKLRPYFITEIMLLISSNVNALNIEITIRELF